MRKIPSGLLGIAMVLSALAGGAQEATGAPDACAAAQGLTDSLQAQ
ncbi:MAG: hypothetical protein GWP08_01895 [Nitrospiraceae bacterium]|nr:hypothetical protein [Nitrospiraceae bacterium]